MSEQLLSYEEQLEIIKSREPVRKLVLILPDGRRVSPWAGKTGSSAEGLELEYKEGEVTRAPEGSQGITTYSEGMTLKAVGIDDWKKRETGGRFALHKAFPIGKFTGLGWQSALLLGECVEEEPEPLPVYPEELELIPEEEWVDVTSECTSMIVPNVNTPLFYISLKYENHQIATLAVRGSAIAQKGYKVEFLEDERYHYMCGGFRVYKK